MSELCPKNCLICSIFKKGQKIALFRPQLLYFSLFPKNSNISLISDQKASFEILKKNPEAIRLKLFVGVSNMIDLYIAT